MANWKEKWKYRRTWSSGYYLATLFLLLAFAIAYMSYLDIGNLPQDIASFIAWIFSLSDTSWIETLFFEFLNFYRFEYGIYRLKTIASFVFLVIGLTFWFQTFHKRTFQSRHNMKLVHKEPSERIEEVRRELSSIYSNKMNDCLYGLYRLFKSSHDFGCNAIPVCLIENEIADHIASLKDMLKNKCCEEDIYKQISLIENKMAKRRNTMRKGRA